MAAVALTAAACGGGNGGSSTASSTGTPVRGGTLKIIGSGDVDHLDTASGYYTVTYTLERTFTRQLFSYPASTDLTTANAVVPDVATEIPTKANGGISADGKTYTVHLRSGVMWNTSPARPVTAADFVLGFERLCNPVNPVGAPGYYTNTIAGMSDYCNGFAKVGQTAPDIASYIQSHSISGITTHGDSTIVFTLTSPAADFLNILALPFASAAPKEYLSYAPDSADFRQHTISDGPYQITKYVAGKEFDLARNPAWQQSSDPIRHQYVNAISIVEGQSSDTAVQEQLKAGTADLSWDLPVPTADIPALQAAKDPNLGIYPTPDTNPYLVFNLLSPNNGGALGKVAVRQAIEYAIDKVAIGKIYGGPALNTPLNQVIPPGNLGYQQFNLYPTKGNAGDPAKCKSMLAAAGYPNGLTLTDVARNSGNHPAIAQSVQADLAKCGITTRIVPVSQGDYYGKYLNSPGSTKAGTWDISEPGWVPDWFGNNGRSIIEPLFDGRGYGPNSTDYGDYNSPTVNALIDKALAASSESEAARYWHEADMSIMKDAPFVPFQTQKTPLYHSTRVKNAIFSPFSQSFDLTNLWLSPAS